MQIKDVDVTMYCNKMSKINVTAHSVYLLKVTNKSVCEKTEQLQINRKSQICDTEKTASGGMTIETE